MEKQSESRRSFLKASAATLAASASVLGANDRVQMAVIGTGTRGTQVHGAFLKHKDAAFTAACDVARDRLDQFLKVNPDEKMDAYGDYRRVLERKDIDAVLITTPDHWHSPIMVAAVEAGKDVYVEKPVSNTIAAALKMVEAARTHKQVVQVGLQQRSWDHFQECAKIIQDGYIGKVTHCVMNFASSYTRAPEQPEDPPSTLDWEMFQGPAPRRPYTPGRQRGWRGYYDYGGGIVTDWGVHLWDVAHWFMNADAKTPLLASAVAQYVRFDVPSKDQVPDAVIVSAQYDNFVASFTNQAMPNPEFELWGNYFFGDRGTMLVNRLGYMIRPNPVRRRPGGPEPPPPIENKFFKSPAGMSENSSATLPSATTNHARNFLDCVKSRKQTVCPMEVGFNSSLPCLLGVVAIQQGRSVGWDRRTAQVV